MDKLKIISAYNSWKERLKNHLKKKIKITHQHRCLTGDTAHNKNPAGWFC